MSPRRVRPPSLPRAARAPRRGLAAALGLAVALALWLVWDAGVRPLAARRIGARLGQRVELGWLRPTLDGGLVAGDVVVYGKPPFDGQPLAFVERLTVQTGGPGAWPTPRHVLAEGVDLQILYAPAGDNLRGAADRGQPAAPRRDLPGHAVRATSATSAAEPARQLPALSIRSGRLTATLSLPGGHRVALRARGLSAEHDPRGGGTLVELGEPTVELHGALTARLPALIIEAPHAADGAIIVSGRGGQLALPGGEALARDLTVDFFRSRSGARLQVQQAAPEPGATALALALRLDGDGLALDAKVQALPLAAAAPLLDRRGVGVRAARLDATASARLRPDERVLTFEGELAALGLDLQHPAVDPLGWRGVHASAQVRGRFDLDAGLVQLDEVAGRLLSVPFLLSGQVEVGERPRGRLVVSSPRGGLDCRGLVAGQPGPVREALAGLELDGRLDFRVAVAFDAADWEDLGLDVRVPRLCQVVREPDAIAGNLAALRGQVAAPLRERPELPVGPHHPDFVPIGRIPAHVIHAFLTAEDNNFYLHNGFQVDMIRRALGYNLERGRLSRGASTITQQLAKNLFLTHDRTLSRKLAETVLTWRLDALLPKRRQLELYLNVVELGPDLRGLGPAALRYFGKAVGTLETLEGAHLASLPPNPRGFARRFRDGRIDDGWLHRLYDLLATMQRRGHLSGSQVTAARANRLLLRKI